jgi:hypothetical protein
VTLPRRKSTQYASNPASVYVEAICAKVMVSDSAPLRHMQAVALRGAFMVSDEPTFGEGEAGSVADDDVVQDSDIEELQGVDECARDLEVRAAGLGNAGGVIVGKDDGCGVVSHHLPRDLANVDVRVGNRAAEELLEGDEPTMRIEV